MIKKSVLNLMLLALFFTSTNVMAKMDFSHPQSFEQVFHESSDPAQNQDSPWWWGDECVTDEDCSLECSVEHDDCQEEASGYCIEGFCYWNWEW